MLRPHALFLLLVLFLCIDKLLLKSKNKREWIEGRRKIQSHLLRFKKEEYRRAGKRGKVDENQHSRNLAAAELSMNS